MSLFRRRGRSERVGAAAIRAREIVAAAIHSGRRHRRSILVIAVVVFGLSALVEAALEEWGRASTVGFALTTVVGSVAVAADILGEVFFVGVLDRLVGEAAHGRPAQSIPTVIRTLPYRPLILADVLVTILFLVALLPFMPGVLLLPVPILPGVIVFTLLCLSGPIVNIEGRSAVSAIRRSAQLVLGRFGLAFLLVTVPFFVADWFATSIEETFHSLPFGAEFLIHLTVTVVIAVVTGLIQVELAHRLIEVDGESGPDRRPRSARVRSFTRSDQQVSPSREDR